MEKDIFSVVFLWILIFLYVLGSEFIESIY